MKLTYFKGHAPNFGDELNTFMWEKLLPHGFLDDNEDELFIGIGSIISDIYPQEAKKYVLGSGFAGYTIPPNLHDGSWDVVFVRGPLTAERLDLPVSKAICDSAVLLRAIDLPNEAAPINVGFMPHYESLDRGFWQEACDLAGVKLIDPTLDVEEILSQLRGAHMLITEAMHGAIVADALRVPWISALPINPIHHRKWQDWSRALSLTVRHHRLASSSALEAWTKSTGGRGDVNGRAGWLGRSVFAAPVNHVLTHRAAKCLQHLARQEPQLSEDSKIEEVTDRALSALHDFVGSRQKRSRDNAQKMRSCRNSSASPVN